MFKNGLYIAYKTHMVKGTLLWGIIQGNESTLTNRTRMGRSIKGTLQLEQSDLWEGRSIKGTLLLGVSQSNDSHSTNRNPW